MHDIVIVGVPLLAIMGGVLFNNAANNRVEAKIDRLQADLSQFYMILGKHEGKIESLEKRPA